MNTELIEKAKLKIPMVPMLINAVSRRVRQLNAGMRPYVKPIDANEPNVDIALREIGEGKLTVEIGFFNPPRAQSANRA
jgi:DNA-directed RNA polymerase omega subunit